MKICWTIDGKETCFIIPVIEYPVARIPGPDPERAIYDLVVIASFEAAASGIANEGARKHLQSGFSSALKEITKGIGAKVRIEGGAGH
jgi:hypothetical protein